MKASSSQPKSLLNLLEEDDYPERQEGGEGVVKWGIDNGQSRADHVIGDMTQRVQCMITTPAQETSKRGSSSVRFALWRQKQKNGAAKLEKQLKKRSEIEDLIEEQLNKFDAHYNHAMVAKRLKDIPQLLMPKSVPPQEQATLYWLGDWRPSAILDFLQGLVACSSSSSSWPTASSHSTTADRCLSELMHDIRIEEAIIDGEMLEIQATCILHLPFVPVKNHTKETSALGCIHSEFKKIEKVINRAQQLRYKAMDVAVRNVLSQMDAAEFFVAFSGMQDMIHQFSAKQKVPRLLLNAPVE